MSTDTYFCFCCLSTNELTNLFDSNSDTNHIHKLKELFSIKPSPDYEDDSYICAECAVRLREAYMFKQQVFDTINILQVNGLVELRKQKEHLVITKVAIDNPGLEAKDGVKNDTKCHLESACDEEIIQDSKPQSDLSPVKKEPIDMKNLETDSLCRTEEIQPVIDNTVIAPEREERAAKKAAKECYVVAEDLKCDVCMETLPNTYMFHRHMNDHFQNHVCDTCGKGFVTEKRLKRHMYSHDRGPFKCQNCDAVFTNYSTYNGHRQRKHSSQYQYACPHCPERLRTYARRALHLAAAHAQHAKYPCSACGKTFLLAGNLSQHMRSQHLKIKRYACNVCEASFFHKQELVSHVATHTGVKLFRCDVCHKSYPRNKSLKVHMLTHSQQKPFSCDACGKSFAQKCALSSHTKTHSGLEKKRRSKSKSSSKTVQSTVDYSENPSPKRMYSEEIIPKGIYSEEIIPKGIYSEDIIPKGIYSEDVSPDGKLEDLSAKLTNLVPLSSKEEAKLIPANSNITKLVETVQLRPKLSKIEKSDKVLYNCYKLFY